MEAERFGDGKRESGEAQTGTAGYRKRESLAQRMRTGVDCLCVSSVCVFMHVQRKPPWKNTRLLSHTFSDASHCSPSGWVLQHIPTQPASSASSALIVANMSLSSDPTFYFPLCQDPSSLTFKPGDFAFLHEFWL